MAAWNDKLVLKVVNVLVFVFLIGSGIYGTLLPDHGLRGYGKTTYITPAPYSFWVWTLIDILLLGYVVIQFFESGFELVADVVGWRFAALAVLNALFVHLYARGHYVGAFILVLFLALGISHVYYDLKKNPPKDLAGKVCVHLPWSLWHAWSVVLVVVSLFAAFGKSTHSHAGVWTKIFVIVALVFLASTSVGYAFHSDRGDIAGAAVIAWTLLAIFSEQRHPASIHWVALGAAIVSILALAKAIVFTSRGASGSLLSDPERAPLVAGSD